MTLSISRWFQPAGGKPVTLTARLAISYAVFGGVIVAALLGLSYLQFDNALRQRAHAETRGEWKLVHDEISRLEFKAFALEAAAADSALRAGHPGLNIAILAPTGDTPIALRGDEARDLARLAAGRSWSDVIEFDWDSCLMAAKSGASRTADGVTVRLIVGIDRTEDRELLAAHLRHLLLAWLVAILLIGAIAGILARRSLAPLHRFNEQVSAVSVRRLDQRLDAGNTPAELHALALSFNNLLARLDDSFARLNAFSSDIAHELRNPLANLVGKTQLTLSRERDANQYREALESNAEELERLSHMVADMLFLARAENAALALNWEEVNLAQLCAEVAEFYEVAAQERGIRIEVSGRGIARADPNLVRRAVGNLLSNSIRHTPDNATIDIRVSDESGQHPRIEVSNPGDGIAPGMRERIFQRFVRGDQSRQREGAGSVGLGLSIVRSIMNLHGGGVDLSSPAGGKTTFALQFGGQGPATA
jgi:two-component system heavy metal sensor histidine kinase CusS